MKSMTGYGRGQASDANFAVTVEVNSVNRKQLEPAINLPRDLAALEPRVREIIAASLSRGRINVLITTASLASDATSNLIDYAAADRAHAALRELADRYALTEGVSLRSILHMPGVLRVESHKVDQETVWPTLEKSLHLALEQLIAMRTREGVDLGTDLENRAANIASAIQKIRQLHPAVVEKYRAALHERIRKVGIELELDDERLTREVVLFADRCDISEELTRLHSHLGQFSENLTRSEPIGRTLEFIVQEIGRELNTLGAKANDASISQLIVTCKGEMEKIREQVQNIE
jgi:uncharacterized protein (TIGR00255 family)